MEVGPFSCSICGEASLDLCIYCTKDTCGNHLCERCRRCSDCCQCEMPIGLSNRNGHEHASPVAVMSAEPESPSESTTA